MPFTDPMADGPAIQAAGLRGLRAGATMKRTLAMVRAFRTEDDTTPIVLMGYLNPILSYTVAAFCADAAAAGVDGLIVVDLPTEEADLLAPHAAAHGIDIIRLVAPTTDDARLPLVLDGSSGFVYYVSITGITGTRSASVAELAAAIPRVRRVTDLPIAVGFGVRTPEQAAEVVRLADGAVVGSALVDTLLATLDDKGRARPDTVGRVLDQVEALAKAVRGARGAGMSWLTEFVRPKIRTLFARRDVPDNLWHQCPACQQMIFQRDLIANLKVCPHCGHHMRATATERLDWTVRRGHLHPHRAAQAAVRPAALPRHQALCRPPEGSPREDPPRRRDPGCARHHRRRTARSSPRWSSTSSAARWGPRSARASSPPRVSRCCRMRR